MANVRTGAVTVLLLSVVGACGLNAAGEAPLDGGASADGTLGGETGTADGPIGSPHRVTEAGTGPDALRESGGRRPEAGLAADAPRESALGDSPSSSTCPAIPDCTNTACLAEGYACVPSAPAGATFAAVDLGGDSPCPTGYGPDTVDVSLGANSPAACGCSCSVTSTPSCTSGQLSTVYGSSDCTGNSPYMTTANDGGCANIPTPVAPFVKVTGTPSPTGPATCAGTVTATVPTLVQSPVSVCPLSAATPPTGGCTGGSVCAHKPTHRSLCVATPGVATCPATYPSLVAAGTSVVDTRGCTGTCTCTASPRCGDESWVFFHGSNCNGSSVALNMDRNCDATDAGSGDYNSYQYQATATVGCSPGSGAGAASGSVTLSGESTLCCE